MPGKFDPAKCSPRTLEYMSEAIDAMMLDNDGRFVGASGLCLAAFGETDFENWRGRRADEVLDEYDAKTHPGSEFCCNGGRAFREATDRARSVGTYTAFAWMLNESGALLRMTIFVRKVPVGFAVVLVPVDDPFAMTWVGYDAKSGLLSSRWFPNAWTWEDVAIFDELMAGSSQKQIAEDLDLSPDRVRYRIRRAEEIQGRKLQEIIDVAWRAASDERVLTKRQIIHGRCNLYRPTGG